jgi:hypothetical protein
MRINCNRHPLVLVTVLMLVLGSSVSAHENSVWPYVTISCDKIKQVLIVSEGTADSEAEIPRNANAWGLDEMLQFMPIGTEDGITEVKSPLRQECKIAKSTYQIAIQPYNYNHRIQGMCGAAAPSAQLTIFRNGKIFIRNLVFRINCLADGDTDNKIEEILFSELNHHAVFQLRKKTLVVQKIVNFSVLPTLRRASLF